MNDSTLERLRILGGGIQPSPKVAPRELGDEGACPGFGYLRGLNAQAHMVEFRLRNRNRFALPYSWLGLTAFDPSVGITLRFTGDTTYRVTIEGSNLGSMIDDGIDLYERGLLRHRVTWIRVMDHDEIKLAGRQTITIDAIRIEELRLGGEWNQEWTRL